MTICLPPQPPWFDNRISDRTRRPIEFWGNPRNIPRVPDKGAPFTHTDDKRIDRPTMVVHSGSRFSEVVRC